MSLCLENKYQRPKTRHFSIIGATSMQLHIPYESNTNKIHQLTINNKLTVFICFHAHVIIFIWADAFAHVIWLAIWGLWQWFSFIWRLITRWPCHFVIFLQPSACICKPGWNLDDKLKCIRFRLYCIDTVLIRGLTEITQCRVKRNYQQVLTERQTTIEYF